MLRKELFILYYDISDRKNTVPRLKSWGILPIAIIKIYRAVIVNILSCTLYNEYVTWALNRPLHFWETNFYHACCAEEKKWVTVARSQDGRLKGGMSKDPVSDMRRKQSTTHPTCTRFGVIFVVSMKRNFWEMGGVGALHGKQCAHTFRTALQSLAWRVPGECFSAPQGNSYANPWRHSGKCVGNVNFFPIYPPDSRPRLSVKRLYDRKRWWQYYILNRWFRRGKPCHNV